MNIQGLFIILSNHIRNKYSILDAKQESTKLFWQEDKSLFLNADSNLVASDSGLDKPM